MVTVFAISKQSAKIIEDKAKDLLQSFATLILSETEDAHLTVNQARAVLDEYFIFLLKYLSEGYLNGLSKWVISISKEQF
jgi:hypothetical protein